MNISVNVKRLKEYEVIYGEKKTYKKLFDYDGCSSHAWAFYQNVDMLEMVFCRMSSGIAIGDLES